MRAVTVGGLIPVHSAVLLPGTFCTCFDHTLVLAFPRLLSSLKPMILRRPLRTESRLVLGSVLIFALPLGAEIGTIAAAFAQSAPAQFPASPVAAGQSQSVPASP